MRVFTDYRIDVNDETWEEVRGHWNRPSDMVGGTWIYTNDASTLASDGGYEDSGNAWGSYPRNDGTLDSGYHNGPKAGVTFYCGNCHDDTTQATKPGHRGYRSQYRLRSDEIGEGLTYNDQSYYPIASGGVDASADPDPFDTFFVVYGDLTKWFPNSEYYPEGEGHKMDSSAPIGERGEKYFVANIFCLTCHDDAGRIGSSSHYYDDEYAVGATPYKDRYINTPVPAIVQGESGRGRDVLNAALEGPPNISKLWILTNYGDNGYYLDGDAEAIEVTEGTNAGLYDFVRYSTTAVGEDRDEIEITGGHIVKSTDGIYLQRGDKIPCISCHDPHGSLAYNLMNDRIVKNVKAQETSLTKDNTPPELCFTCHQYYIDEGPTYVEGGDILRVLEGLHIPRPPDMANGRVIGPHFGYMTLIKEEVAGYEPGEFYMGLPPGVTRDDVKIFTSCIGKYESGNPLDNGCHFSPHDPRVTDCGGCHYDEFPYEDSDIYGTKEVAYKQHPVYQPLAGDILKWYEQVVEDDRYKQSIVDWVNSTEGADYYLTEFDFRAEDDTGDETIVEMHYNITAKGPDATFPPPLAAGDKDAFYDYVLNKRIDYADIPLGPSNDVWCLSCHNNHRDAVWPFSSKIAYISDVGAKGTNGWEEGSVEEWMSSAPYSTDSKAKYNLTQWDQARMRMQIPFVCNRCHEKVFRGVWEYDEATGEQKDTLLHVKIAENDHGGFTAVGDDMGTVRCPKCHSIHGRHPVGDLEVAIHLGMYKDDFSLYRGTPTGDSTPLGEPIYQDKRGDKFTWNPNFPKMLHYSKEFRLCGKCHGSDHDQVAADPSDPTDPINYYNPLYDQLYEPGGTARSDRNAKNRPPNIYYPSVYNGWRTDTLFSLFDDSDGGAQVTYDWLQDYDTNKMLAVYKRRRFRNLGSYTWDEAGGGSPADIVGMTFNPPLDAAEEALNQGSDHDMYGEFGGGDKTLIGWPTTPAVSLAVRCGMCHDPHGSNSYVQLREIMDIGGYRNGRNNPLEEKDEYREKPIPNIVKAEKLYAMGGAEGNPQPGDVAGVDDKPLYNEYRYWGGVTEDPVTGEIEPMSTTEYPNGGIVAFCTSCHVMLDDTIFDFVADPELDNLGNPTYDIHYQRHPVDIDIFEIYNNRVNNWTLRVQYDLENESLDQWYPLDDDRIASDMNKDYKAGAESSLNAAFAAYYDGETDSTIVLELGFIYEVGGTKPSGISFGDGDYSGYTYPDKDLNKPTLGRVICLSCHKVHGSNFQRLRKFDGIKSCVRICHPYVLEGNKHGQY